MLLDTHVVLWWIQGDVSRLSDDVVARLSSPGAEITISAVVLWEAAIKRGLGKLDPPLPDLLALLRATGVRILPITAEHADRVGTLPSIHRDPFDRLLVAQAQAEGLPIVSADPLLGAYGVEVLS